MSSAITPAWTPDLHRPSGRQNKPSLYDTNTINSPLLFEMLKNLSLTEQRIVLDSGAASQSSIDFFSDYWCKLIITDAMSDLHKPDLKSDDALNAWHTTLGKTIRFNQHSKSTLDIIFLWTLPNYLSPQQLKSLIAYLLPHTSLRVKLHAYIYTTQRMPAEPAHYHITRNHKVIISPVTSEQRNCPLYHLADLHNCFNPFKVDHSVMLSSGIQEYIFSA
jgi:hypothetical protein